MGADYALYLIYLRYAGNLCLAITLFNLLIMIAQVLASGGIVAINQGYAIFRALKLQWLKRVTARKLKKMDKNVFLENILSQNVHKNALVPCTM